MHNTKLTFESVCGKYREPSEATPLITKLHKTDPGLKLNARDIVYSDKPSLTGYNIIKHPSTTPEDPELQTEGALCPSMFLLFLVLMIQYQLVGTLNYINLILAF